MIPNQKQGKIGGDINGPERVSDENNLQTTDFRTRKKPRLPCPRCKSMDTKFCYYNIN